MDWIGASPEPPATASIGPVWPCRSQDDPDGVVRLQVPVDVARCHSFRNMPDVKLELGIPRLICHRIVSRRASGHGEADILSGRECKRITGKGETDDPDVMCYVPHFCYPRRNLADRMVRLFFLVAEPGKSQIVLWQCAAGEDKTCCLFGVSQGETAVFQQIDLAVDQPRLAGAAAPRPASMGVVDTLFDCRFQNGLGRGDLNGPVRLMYPDLP